MSSSEDDGDFEDNSLCKYGTQLPQYEADEIPSKKPLQKEDMVVKDENGRRRFHGAFTGGFSAGYWNTVGSKEGFTPQEFKSSRAEKASMKTFKPTDFMDEEDFSEFGIAPQMIQTKEDFGNSNSSGNKRKREKPSEGPIPGEPVLRNLLKPVRDKAAVRILKSMGWRDNQGIGSRMTYSEKKRANNRNQREMYVKKNYSENNTNEDDDDELSDDEITFAPDDFDPYIMNMKDNTFGLGYSGLKPTTSKSSENRHVNLFKTFVDRTNKKFSIAGTAFGVGALEEEDDDIYEMDDMSNYDKTLENEVVKRSNKPQKVFDASLLEGFSKATISDCQSKNFSVDVPRSYVPRNWLSRKTRFEPLDKNRSQEIEAQNRHRKLGLGRHDLKPDERGALLNEPKVVKISEEEKALKKEESAKKISELLNSKQFVSENNATFKPFIANPDKQERYDKFIALNSSDEKEIEKLLNDIQPLGMSSFDREMERKEFMQAKRMYQPLDSIMSNRFIKEIDAVKEQEVKKKIQNGKEIIVIERTTSMWKPHKNVCKRFNVPEPYGGLMFDEEEEKKRKKQSSTLFDYIGVPLNTKSNFVAPQVIPRKLTDDNRQKKEEEEKRKKFLEAIEKEKSFMGSTISQRASAKDFFESDNNGNKTDEMKEKRKELPEPPKTELEKKVAESINKKPEEKKDLFKAIFCDSDDEDEEEETPLTSSTSQELPTATSSSSSILTEQQKSKFIESFLSTKPASEINVLRNKSPPRGIFKGIFDMATTSKRIEEISTTEEKEEEFYGPKPPISLPTTHQTPNHSSTSSHTSNDDDDSDLDEKLLRKLKKTKKGRHKEDEDNTVWIEKEKAKKSKKEKKKKKKSHKKDHKKHKSKK